MKRVYIVGQFARSDSFKFFVNANNVWFTNTTDSQIQETPKETKGYMERYSTALTSLRLELIYE